MLTDEQITEALAHIDKRYQKVCRMYLEKVGATIRELGHLNSSRLNLLVQLQKMGVSERQIIRELQKTTDLTKEDIHRLYHKAAEESVQDARYLYLAKGSLPNWQPMEYLVQAMWEQTAGKLDNLSGTTAIGKAYRQIVDEAVTAVTMGVEDYNSAIRNSLRLLGRAGLQTEYESGHHRRLESAVRQNILDGVRQVQQEAQKLIGEQIGADGVEITAHPHSAPDHEPVQGRQFPIAEFEKMQSGSDFQDADGKHYGGFQRPITQWRCRHLVYYILLGAAKRMYTDEQLRKWEEENHKGCEIDGRHYTRYEATQLMRKLETEIRRENDTAILAEASGDDVLRRKSQSNITALTAKYKYVADVSGLRTRFDKTRMEGRGFKCAKETAKTYKGVSKSEHSFSPGIGSSKTDLEYIESEAYKSKFSSISDNPKLNRAIYERCRAAVTHQSGKFTEDLSVVDLQGNLIGATSSKVAYETQYSQRLKRAVLSAEPYSLVSIHDHGTNVPPSGADFGSAGSKKYAFGIVACHDGSVYYYSTQKAKPFTAQFYDQTVDKFRKSPYNYDEIKAYTETLKQFEKFYGIEWRKL